MAAEPPTAYLYARMSQEESNQICPRKTCAFTFTHRTSGNTKCPKCGAEVNVEQPLSLENQKQRMLEYVKFAFPDTKPKPTIIYVHEIASRKTPLEERPVGRRIIDDMKARDHLIVTKLERGWGNVLSFLKCHQHIAKIGAFLHTVHERMDTSTAHGKMFATFMVMMAELEWEQHSERRKSVHKFLKVKGRPRGIPEVGFKIEIDPDTNQKTYVRDEYMMELLCWAYILHDVRKIAYDKLLQLAEVHGYKNSVGNPLTERTLKKYVQAARIYVADGVIKPPSQYASAPDRN